MGKSGTARQRLSSIKWNAINRLGVDPFVRAFEMLPRSQAVRILESIQLTGQLDYAPAKIEMELRSVYDLSRLRSCFKEPRTIDWIEREVRPGDVFYDVGANVGAYSLVAWAATGGRAKVYAFEPSYATFPALCTNLRLNGCGDAVQPLPIALSDRTQLLSFNYSSVRVGSAMHSVGEPIDMFGKPFAPEFVQPVLSYRLDDMISSFALAPPTQIKIDVDGAEHLVLAGGARTLERPSLRSLLVEVQLGSSSATQIVDRLSAQGFSLRGEGASITDGFANYEFGRG